MQLVKISVSSICLLIVIGCSLKSTYTPPTIIDNAVLQKTLELKMPSVSVLPFQPENLKDKILNELIQETLENSPDIKTAKARIEAARALRCSLTAGLFPSLDGLVQ